MPVRRDDQAKCDSSMDRYYEPAFREDKAV